MEAKLLILLAMLAFAAAGPMRLISDSSDSCATTCKPSSKFQYRPGQTYTYDYTVQTETSMADASEERAALSISGQADIEVIDQCDLALVMRNVQIQELGPAEDSRGMRRSPQSEELSRLLQTPLRFSFQDGVVAELCPSSEEDSWALNIKRGVLSAFQNSMDQLQGSQTVQESDVTGTCETTYEVLTKGYWGPTTVKRSKDLMTCADRHGYTGSLQSAQYQTESGLQTLPLMTSEHECEQQVSGGVLQSSRCTERHLFRPFSSERSGAVTTVMQQLTFRSQGSGMSTRKD